MNAENPRRTLITGGAGGIGRALATAAAAHGEDLVLLDIDEGALTELAAELSDSGVAVEHHAVDVADRDQVRRVFAGLGRIDVAYLNAGIHAGKNFMAEDSQIDTLDIDVWNTVINVNLNGFFHTLQAVAQIMKAQRSGAIVATASTAGLRAEPLVSYPYVASKSAVVALVRQSALELSRFGIRVNAIAPGPVSTGISGATPLPADKKLVWDASIPVGRFAQPEEVVPLARLLAAEESAYITGSIMVADGGAASLSQVNRDFLPAPAI